MQHILTKLKGLLILSTSCFFLLASSMAAANNTQFSNNKRFSGSYSLPVFGLQKIRSQFNVDETTARLEAEIVNRGLGIFAVIDHAANAANVGKTLRPTKLIIFGNPNIGSELMASEQSIGIDLPQKFLIWEDEFGNITIAYNKPKYLKFRHRIFDKNMIFDNISNALSVIANTAAGNNI